MGSPELFSAQSYESSGQDTMALFLGGPRDDFAFRRPGTWWSTAVERLRQGEARG